MALRVQQGFPLVYDLEKPIIPQQINMECLKTSCSGTSWWGASVLGIATVGNTQGCVSKWVWVKNRCPNGALVNGNQD